MIQVEESLRRRDLPALPAPRHCHRFNLTPEYFDHDVHCRRFNLTPKYYYFHDMHCHRFHLIHKYYEHRGVERYQYDDDHDHDRDDDDRKGYDASCLLKATRWCKYQRETKYMQCRWHFGSQRQNGDVSIISFVLANWGQTTGQKCAQCTY